MAVNPKDTVLFKALLEDEQDPAPVIFIKDGNNGASEDLVLVNFDQFKDMPPAEIEATVKQINQIINERLSKEEHAHEREQIKERVHEAAKNAGDGPTLQSAGGGFAISNQNMIFIDKRTSIPETFLKSATGNPPDKELPFTYSDRDHNLHNEFARNHEGAHATLGLHEPGSDFMATAAMLHKYPESPEVREFLKHTSEMRYAAGIYGNEQAMQKYGVENYDAIQHALSLDKAKQLPSLEEMNQLILMAEQFDHQNANNNLAGMSTELLGRKDIMKETQNVMQNLGAYIEKNTTPQSTVNEPYPQGAPPAPQ